MVASGGKHSFGGAHALLQGRLVWYWWSRGTPEQVVLSPTTHNKGDLNASDPPPLHTRTHLIDDSIQERIRMRCWQFV